MKQRQDARKWLEEQIQELTSHGQTWSSGRPYGDLLVPREGLSIHEPIVIPMRCNIVGPHTAIFDRASFEVADGYEEGDVPWAISWEDSASQGNFAQQARNVSLDCRGRSDGIKFTGDQGSRYVSILVEHAMVSNVMFHGVTHGSTATNIWVKGSHEDDPIRGEGIAMENCSSLTLIGASIHRCDIGLDKQNCANCQDIGTDFEKVVTPYIWANAVNCDSSSHHMLHQDYGGILGSFRDCGLSTVKGTLRKGHSAEAWAVIDGTRTRVSSQADKNDPKPFIIPLP